MRKTIKIPANGNIGPTQDVEEAKRTLKSVFEQANPGMSPSTDDLVIDNNGKLSGKVEVSLEQPAPANPTPAALNAWSRTIELIREQQGMGPSDEAMMALPVSTSPASMELQIEAIQNEDEDDIIEPDPLPESDAAAATFIPPVEEPVRTLKFLFEEPQADTVATPGAATPSDLEDCPVSGDGGDPQLNVLKNRKKKGEWKNMTIQKILSLDWDTSIEKRHRSEWSSEAMDQVNENEKMGALRIEGWLAGAKKEGAESCNCHSPTEVDYHLWIVDDKAKASKENRFLSVVAEVTPRVRAEREGWDISRIAKVVKAHTKVRLSGWLMMDQEHPEQLPRPNQHSTRGTLWEMHPIIEFEVEQEGEWVALSDAILQGESS